MPAILVRGNADRALLEQGGEPSARKEWLREHHPPGARAAGDTQGLLMGGVASVITTMLLLLSFLDNAFHSGVGGLKPAAMERSLRVLDEVVPTVVPDLVLPCDAQGRPL